VIRHLAERDLGGRTVAGKLGGLCREQERERPVLRSPAPIAIRPREIAW
jgi:hypothetical protein